MEGISCYIIHSKQKNVQQSIKTFQEDSRPVVALAVGMLKVGFDDKNVEWSIIAQPSHKADVFTQQAGRTVRIRENNIAKIGYVLTFSSANIHRSQCALQNYTQSFFVNKQYEIQRKKRLSIRPNITALEILDKKSSDQSIPQAIRIDLFNGNSYPLTQEKLNLIEKRNQLLSELEKLESQLKENVTPKTKLLTPTYPTSFLKPTGPWDGESLAKKRKHTRSMLESRIDSVKNDLEKLGVPKEQLYKEGFGIKKQKFNYQS
jgi:type I site-specific restriction endonuclease